MNGISSGYWSAILVTLAAWFAILRIFVVAMWELYEAILLHPLKGGSQFFAF